MKAKKIEMKTQTECGTNEKRVRVKSICKKNDAYQRSVDLFRASDEDMKRHETRHTK